MNSAPVSNIAKQLETLPSEILNYIKELELNHTLKIKELETNIKEIQFEHEVLKEKYDLLIYKRFVRSAEQLLADKNQRLLFNNEEIAIEEIKETKQLEFEEVKSFKRKKQSGRKAIDEKIPRVERVIDIEETEKSCACGCSLSRIGEESNEKLHIVPPRIYVEKTIRPKYACRKCEGTEDESKKTVRIAPLEPAIIPKGIASPSMLSWIFTHKFEDHLPFYRQEKAFERIMVSISRQDMSNWQQHVYKRIKPLFIIMKEMLKQGPVIKMDETRVQVIGEQDRDDRQNSFMWLAKGGVPEKPVILYQYRRSRAGEHAKEILEGYEGFLQTDGYKGYDCALKGNNKIIHVGCFAHLRRKIFEAVKVSSRIKTKTLSTAEEGIQFIKRLYVIEAGLREIYAQEETEQESQRAMKREYFLHARKMACETVLDEFKEWLLKLKDEVPPSTLLGTAVEYGLSQWEKLIRYLESPYLTPDNNECENAIRPFVIGRKNWLFCQSPSGAESSCGMYSLIQTAKANGLIPIQYLTTLFEKAPLASSREDWEKLLPWNIFKS